MTSASVHTVLLAAGRSTRLGGDIAKPWRVLGGKTVAAHALERLAAHPRITSGVLVVAEDARDMAEALAAPYGWRVVIGGAERPDSVKAGLNALDAPDHVLIHDAARPFVSADVLDRLINALEAGHQAVIPALPPSDSLKTAENNIVTGRVERDAVFRIQTPQGFTFSLIKALHDNDHNSTATDDASLVEDAGQTVHLCQGDAMMDKITTADDLARAEILV
ncbi:MAG: 2-C-methyl-D-erythritol 4-phosphate cytidylyltransferase, partial [Alphaproteobacteria bacterium]|nr:2-C-methyl-D-erythritol 4-phosphate cytidylyltransferase [Alphaproteobacteria bacterium]